MDAPEPADISATLLARARAVIPGGMYGHQSTKLLWPGAPQFVARGDGAYLWDIDGKRYIDLMCGYGPIIHGYRHPKVEQAAARQALAGDCQNLPSPVIVELAERLVSIVDHAAWAIFMKNGTDATTLALTVARAATGRKRILVAHGAYHGAAPWCSPSMFGVPEEERANLVYYTFNDITSVDEAVALAGADLAAIIVSPFRHDAGFDQELVDVAFARHLRSVCDKAGALLILDDVRCGFRMAFGSSWEPIGVAPDLSTWSKAIGNGYPLAALLGSAPIQDVAANVFATGSFWFAAVPMAASLATLELLEHEGGVEQMNAVGTTITKGMSEQARSLGLHVNITGHPTMPYLTFAGEVEWQWSKHFAAECAARGLFVHPRHNWFVSTAITDKLADEILVVTDLAFTATKAAGAPAG